MLPMLLSVSVPPVTSSCGSRPAAAKPYDRALKAHVKPRK